MEKIPVDKTKLTAALEQLLPALHLPEKKQRILELEDQMQDPKFWQDTQWATSQSQEHSQLTKIVEFWENFAEALARVTDAAELHKLAESFHQNRLQALFTGAYDANNAIVAVHAGAGGTDAQDWAEMVLRMLLRFAENHGFAVDVVEKQAGSEAGIKSATFQVVGHFAYGYFKSEAGVHRLVRQSPYNPAHTRETSFCLVEVLPELPTKSDDLLKESDVEMEVTTASGHGGQSVNTTYSAVRLTHKPTGIRVSIQNERSQQQNRELAYKILRARVAELAERELQSEKKALRGEFKSAEWGNQIRSYVLHPYQMVKDHRTNQETTDTAGVLEGDLDEFVSAFLESLHTVRRD